MGTAAALAILAVGLAGPVPWLMVRRADRLRPSPRAAMVLWQSVALAAVLSAVGAGLAVVTSAGWGSGHAPREYAVAAVALLLTAMVVGRLLVTGHRVGLRLRRQRSRHRHLVDLVAHEWGGVFVVKGEAPVAYCLPAISGHRVVLSSGAADALAADERAAVVAHERAHLTARHDLVLEAFTVLNRAFPRPVSSRAALAEVSLLTELLADAHARRRVGALPLARALVKLTEAGRLGIAPTGMLAARSGSADLTARVQRLRDEGSHRILAAAELAAAVAVLALPTLYIVAPWLTSLR